MAAAAGGEAGLLRFLDEVLLPLYDAAASAGVALGLKRVLYHAHRDGALPRGARLDRLRVGVQRGRSRRDQVLEQALAQLRSRPVVFVAAEAEPFSKSGGLANVTCELPRELAGLGERLYVITPPVPQRRSARRIQDGGRDRALRRDLHRVSTSTSRSAASTTRSAFTAGWSMA